MRKARIGNNPGFFLKIKARLIKLSFIFADVAQWQSSSLVMSRSRVQLPSSAEN